MSLPTKKTLSVICLLTLTFSFNHVYATGSFYNKFTRSLKSLFMKNTENKDDASGAYDGPLLVMLGTGTPIPDPNRYGPSLAILVNGKAYIVDCGVGCLRRATYGYVEKGLNALTEKNLDRLFITHLHSDHTLGYPDLILTPWNVRKNTLAVYGPKGTQAMTDNILAAWAEDIKVRIDGLQRADPRLLKPTVTEFDEGQIYQDDNVKVTAFKVHHGTFPNSFGFKFEIGDKVVVISGDTAPVETVIEQAKGADILVHEVYSMKKYEQENEQNKEYLKSFHTSTKELAEIANKTQPKLLVLTHKLAYQGAPLGIGKDEIRKFGYLGNVIDAEDMDVINIQQY